MFFSFLLLISFAYASILDLGPHYRPRDKSFGPLHIPDGKVVILITPECSFCKIQIKKLNCLKPEDVILLLDGEDERGLTKLKVPPDIPVYLTTKKSLELFGKQLIYPSGFVKKEKTLEVFQGAQECEFLKTLISK